MSSITVEENESLDKALKRFKKACQKSGILAEIRKREHYEKPSVKKKRKIEAAKRKMRRQLVKMKRTLERSWISPDLLY